MRSPRDLERYGGRLCLDFVNTLDWRGRDEPEEYLANYRNLLEWSVLAGAITQKQAQELRSISAAAGAKALARARDFREAAYRVLLAAVDKTPPDARDLALLNAVFSDARSHATLEPVRGEFRWTFSDVRATPQLPLRIVATSLADLLASEDLQYVRRCGSADCGWLFLDTTKNHQRRWCSMEGCGNRAKARRHYARSR